MKNWLLIILIPELVFPVFLRSQNLLNQPESIIYDSVYHRYLLSNYGSGDIIQIDSNGNQSYFVQNSNAIQGLEIVGNTVFVGCETRVRGFDLVSGNMVMNIHVTGVTNLNDVTADTSGNLYVSDVFGTKIIKVNIAAQTWWVFVQGNGILNPNGIFYEKNHNRILVCSYRASSPIQAINLADSSVTVLTSTNIGNCDGITVDNFGRCYVTSWDTYNIYRFDSSFSDPPVVVYHNFCGPADISYDVSHNMIAIPLMLCDSWHLLLVEAPSLVGGSETTSLTELIELGPVFPNPAKNQVIVKLNVNRKTPVRLSLFSAGGQDLRNLLDEDMQAGEYKLPIDLGSLPSGEYILTSVSAGGSKSIKLTRL